jgi:hypothetical protein
MNTSIRSKQGNDCHSSAAGELTSSPPKLTGEFSLMAFPGNTCAEVPPGFLRARPLAGRHPTHRARLSAGMTYYSCSPLLDYCGGAEGIRTPDLISAIDALSQLSYSPSKI